MKDQKLIGNNHIYFIGFRKRFQGLAFICSSDNHIIGNGDYFLFEIRFLWFNCYYMYLFEGYE
jgi:hypothetical protein